MSESNKHIELFLKYYLEKEVSPDYAVLLTGCWGAGKTFFIKRFLGGEKKEIKEWLTDCEKYTVVYVSLFGAKNREEMDKRVLEKFHPFLNSAIIKVMPNAVSLLGGIAGAVSANPQITIAGKAISIFSRKFLNVFGNGFKKAVVVFDDVERADMPLPELLGYLNEYVEHLRIPCILLADKEKWEEAQKCQEDKSTLHNLASTKEKVIGKEFQIQTSFEDVWNCWFESDCHLLGDKAWTLLKKYRDIVARVFELSETPNFRSLKHSLLDFQRFIEKIDDCYFKESNFNSLFIADFMARQYTFYLGWYVASDIGESNILKRVFARANKDREKNNDELYKLYPVLPYERFEEKYSEIQRLSSRDSLDGSYSKWENVWKKWFANNYVDVGQVVALLKNSIWYDGKVSFYLNKINNWFELEDEEGEEALLAFEKSLEEGTLKRPTLIMGLFYRLYFYASKGAFKESPQKFKKRMETYVIDHREELEDDEIENWKVSRSQYGMLGTDYLEFESVNDSFLALLCELTEKTRVLRKQKEMELFWNRLKSNSENDYRVSLEKIRSSSFPLKELDVDVFCKVFQIVKLRVRTSSISALKSRYSTPNINHYNIELVNDERVFLEALKNKAEEIYTTAERPLKISVFSLYYLIESIKEILSGKKS